MRRTWLQLTATLLVSSQAMAEPMLSTLDDVVAKSPDVVIATYDGPVDAKADLSPSKLHVHLALRGKLSGDIVAGIVVADRSIEVESDREAIIFDPNRHRSHRASHLAEERALQRQQDQRAAVEIHVRAPRVCRDFPR
jgi:hypothetical protein